MFFALLMKIPRDLLRCWLRISPKLAIEPERCANGCFEPNKMTTVLLQGNKRDKLTNSVKTAEHDHPAN